MCLLRLFDICGPILGYRCDDWLCSQPLARVLQVGACPTQLSLRSCLKIGSGSARGRNGLGEGASEEQIGWSVTSEQRSQRPFKPLARRFAASFLTR